MIGVASWLLAVFTAATLLPEALAVVLGHSTRAWEFVMRGFESLAMVLALAVLMAPRCKTTRERVAVFSVLSFGAFEAAQRPLCRLAFAMDRSPNLPAGQYLCDAAGISTSGLALVLAAVVAFVVAEAAHV